jgi:hypothetical protein
LKRLEFEPFGEKLPRLDDAWRNERASKWLLWLGSVVFWSLAATIVLARAVYFDPSVFAGFERLASLARSVTGL